MVTETRTLEFERYYERSIPTALRSSETPATWPYGAEAWAEHRQAALAYLRSKCELDFCFQVAEKGWRPHELASGRPDQGAAMSNAGVAFRQTVTIPRQLQADAQNALQALFASRANLDPILRDNLERAVEVAGAATTRPSAPRSLRPRVPLTGSAPRFRRLRRPRRAR